MGQVCPTVERKSFVIVGRRRLVLPDGDMIAACIRACLFQASETSLQPQVVEGGDLWTRPVIRKRAIASAAIDAVSKLPAKRPVTRAAKLLFGSSSKPVKNICGTKAISRRGFAAVLSMFVVIAALVVVVPAASAGTTLVGAAEQAPTAPTVGAVHKAKARRRRHRCYYGFSIAGANNRHQIVKRLRTNGAVHGGCHGRHELRRGRRRDAVFKYTRHQRWLTDRGSHTQSPALAATPQPEGSINLKE